MRALEVVLATGQPISGYHRQPVAKPGLNLLHVGIRWERDALYRHLNTRVEAMLARGWIEEVQGVLAKGFAPDAKPLRSIGYLEIVEYLQGTRAKASLTPDIQQRTRNYAKRQLTWFRHQTRVDWFEPADLTAAVSRVEQFLHAGHTP
jgi:tRNA dimethylallyltransferase